MEYAVFVIGIVAIIISVIINQRIYKLNSEEVKLLRSELKSLIELSIEDKEKIFAQRLEPIYKNTSSALERIDSLEVRQEDMESNLGETEHDLDDAVDRIDDIESEIKKISNDIDLVVPATPFLLEECATYLENDSSIMKHIDASGYDLIETVLFMAYVLQNLKDKVYEKKVITHEEPKTKTSTRRKKVSISGDTNNTTTGSEASKV